MINNDQKIYEKYIQEIGYLIQQDKKTDNLSLRGMEQLKDNQIKHFNEIQECLEVINNIPTQDKIETPQKDLSSYQDHNQLKDDLNKELFKTYNTSNDLEDKFQDKFEEINNKVDLLNNKIDLREQAIEEKNLKNLHEVKEQIAESITGDDSKYSEQIQYLTNQVNFLLNKINSSNNEVYLLEILNLTKKINQIESRFKYSNSLDNGQIPKSEDFNSSSTEILDQMRDLLHKSSLSVSPTSTKSSTLRSLSDHQEPMKNLEDLRNKDKLNINQDDKINNIDSTIIKSPGESKNQDNNLKINRSDVLQLEEKNLNPYQFSKNKNPFDYVYNDVSELAFNKKTFMGGSRKLQDLKSERKKLIISHLKQQN